MATSKFEDSLKGYILEEAIAYLIRNTGYSLLIDPSQDSRELSKRGNGLVVYGRGGEHQVDVLGELEWMPAFTYPIRLFAEAKFRSKKVGTEIVRNAIGVLQDVNQNNSPTREQRVFHQKYNYVYALFSTSGFTKRASYLALAHQISLIDMGGSEYEDLLMEIRYAAIAISVVHKKIKQKRLEDLMPDWQEILRRDETVSEKSSPMKMLSSVRYIMRKALGTLTLETNENYMNLIAKILQPVIQKINDYGELFVAMANGPYMILLKAEDKEKFLEYVKQKPKHDVEIFLNEAENGKSSNEVDGFIVPKEDDAKPASYSLRFRLAKKLRDWIFDSAGNGKELTQTNTKSRIMIYYREEEQDHIFTLTFTNKIGIDIFLL